MNSGVMETICTRCNNIPICKYVDKALAMYNDINRIENTYCEDTPFAISFVCRYRNVVTETTRGKEK